MIRHSFDPSTLKYPHDIHVEFDLIGWVLSNNELLNHIGFLTSDDFYSTSHYEIWKAIETLRSQGETATPFTLRPLVQDQAIFDDAGGIIKYLAAAVTSSVTEPAPVAAAKYLVKLSQMRKLVAACDEVIRKATDPTNTLPAEELASTLTNAVEEVTISSPLSEFHDNYDVSAQIIQDLKDDRRPFPTGLHRLDQAMEGGLFPGKSYGFAARKKIGKTTLAATISANLNQSGVKHLFICGEMSPKEIHQRVLARMSGIFASSFRNDYGKSADCGQKLADAAIAMPRNTLYKNAPGLTFDDLRHIATVAVERYSVKGIILDYWQLVGGKLKGQSTAEHLDAVAQWIADFGRRQGIWTITMAQLNQDDNTRGGEGIRLAFDQLYQLHRENVTQPEAWLEMLETRYTSWNNIGSNTLPGLYMREKGPYFDEAQ
jgi:replicative DNA helicase